MYKEEALVYYGNRIAGILKKSKSGYEFIYEKNYLQYPNAAPISLSMPLREEKYESNLLFPFFEGLLPEGWLLNIISTAAKIDRNDKFKLLLHIGQDPIGAVSILPFNSENL
ncbi:MAG: HipA N-terminal domain-containing protein [Elusimicrobia bacterium]|nr:HipA N-terminal domain-containing protein [Elusimicrobiota bacterium]